MPSPPPSRSDFTFPWLVDQQPQNGLLDKLEQVYRLCHLRWQFLETCRQAAQPTLKRAAVALDQTVLATALIVLPGVFKRWDALRPIILSNMRVLLPFVPLPSAEDEALQDDPTWDILAGFQALAPDQQDKAARNLALLWDHFETLFGGLSGFLAETPIEQNIYLDKLLTASRRMKLARGSEVAFHYVTVELMRLYVHGLQLGRTDRAALMLASQVVGLINRGRMVMPALTADPALREAQQAQAA